ncbi:MAG TPA: SCO6880 family protein [Acidimicrobiales bacterium]|nr:SCO6880 family protein [Acidimicrobiales bacterium]
MSDDTDVVGATYRFGPRDSRGPLGGLRSGQVAIAAGALVLGLCSLRALGGIGGALAGLASILLGGLTCAVRIAGRGPDEWAPCVAGFLLRRSRQHARRGAAPAPLTTSGPGAPAGGPGSTEPRRSPAPPGRAGRRTRLESWPVGLGRGLRLLDGVEVVQLEISGGRQLGAVLDRRRGTSTAVLELRADGLPLLGAADRARLVAAWSGLLVATAMQAGGVERLSWIERTLPDRREVLRHPPPGAPCGPARSYEGLLAGETRSLLRHEVLLACTVASRTRRGEAAGGVTGRIAGELERLSLRCQAAGITVEHALDPEQLAAVLSSTFSADGVAAGGGRWPVPLGVQEEWGCLRTDATWHACYWVAEWPRSDVAGDFLLPLLVGSWARRSVSLVMAPRPATRAVRAAEHARTEKAADAELRRRHGFALTARLQREQEAVERREHELAAGHAAYRFSGYVSVTAAGRDELTEACRSVEQAAALSRLELRRLYGSQAEAFCCTLPTGRGCG